jgi:hypothetical protein
VTPDATVDCTMNERMSRRSSPSGCGGAEGNRRKAARPAAATDAVPIVWATRMPRIACVTPKCAPTATPPSRRSIDQERNAERMS